MILYLDTSVMVSALTNEAATPRVQAWLDIQPPDVLTISDWVSAEFSSAISIKMRNREINAVSRAAALREFAELSQDFLATLPILNAHVRAAARMADHHQTGLCAADALHLAICADHAATLCTLDRRLHKAAAHFDVACQLL